LDKLKIGRNKDGQPTEMVGLWLDITERKKDEQQLKEAHDLLKSRSEALEESNTELSQFTYVVSHDLKAHLRAIHSYCDWLSDDLLDSLDGDQKEYIEGMQDAVQQAENLIDDLLELSRVGRRAMAAEPIHLTPFFKDLTQSLITDTNVIIEITENLPIINVSNTLLTQVFQNLIVNAHTYNLSEQKEIKILGEVKGDNYRVSVSDNGMGIEERFHERVFQLFQRLHTKEEIDGTGIGLAIVNKAVSCLNWSITLSSTLGEGSSFSVLIPLSEVKQ
jgi:light-regulated signal transduction histidine kinase (bacteriophytochrome)